MPALPVATMDHRTIATLGDRLVIVGGMVAGQRVTDRVVTVAADALTERH